VLGTAVAALLAVAVDGFWRWARNLVTIVHEGGHAVTAVLTGRRLTGIRLHSDTSGLKLSTGRPSGPGMVATAAAGYLAPSLVGLGGVVLLAFDQVTVMLWAAVAFLLAMLVMVRNAYGVLTLLVTGAAVVGVSLRAPADVQAGFGYAATWFLLLAAVRPVWELARERRRNRRTDAGPPHPRPGRGLGRLLRAVHGGRAGRRRLAPAHLATTVRATPRRVRPPVISTAVRSSAAPRPAT
jgi:hypothetical protein